MAFVPPAAAGGADAVLVALGLLSVVFLLVALGVKGLYTLTIGQLLYVLAEALDRIRIPVWHFRAPRLLHFVAERVREVNRLIYGMLGGWVAVHEKSVVYLFHAVARLTNWIVHEIAQVAKAAFKLGRGVLVAVRVWARRYLRAVIRGLMRAVTRLVVRLIRFALRSVRRQLRWLRKRWALVGALVGALVRRMLPRLLRLLRRLLAPALRALRRLFARLLRGMLRRLRALARVIIRLGRRIHPLRRLMRLLRQFFPWRKFLAWFIRALHRLDLGWLRARSVRRFGKWLMRQPLDLIDELLALLGFVGGSISLIEFAEVMIDVEDDIADVTQEFWEVAA